MKYFETKFLAEAEKFISSFDKKIIHKILYNIDLAEKTNDIWEFRIRYAGLQIRLLAFWDKTNNKETIVFATHGFIKKVDKIPEKEIKRANKIRDTYFDHKNKK